MKLSIIIPAVNEEAFLPSTLDSIHIAATYLRMHANSEVDLIVVDNISTDQTAAVAQGRGATVVREPVQGIARARNTGARDATSDALVFIDADVFVPPTLLHAIHATMSDPQCVGGGVDVDYRPQRRSVRLYLRAWRLLGRLTGMVHGSTQFCRMDVFQEVGGYDETAWMGEDIDFYWRLRRIAKT